MIGLLISLELLQYLLLLHLVRVKSKSERVECPLVPGQLLSGGDDAARDLGADNKHCCVEENDKCFPSHHSQYYQQKLQAALYMAAPP